MGPKNLNSTCGNISVENKNTTYKKIGKKQQNFVRIMRKLLNFRSSLKVVELSNAHVFIHVPLVIHHAISTSLVGQLNSLNLSFLFLNRFPHLLAPIPHPDKKKIQKYSIYFYLLCVHEQQHVGTFTIE